jgi:alkylated DNA repair dioxygenase AlkB
MIAAEPEGAVHTGVVRATSRARALTDSHKLQFKQRGYVLARNFMSQRAAAHFDAATKGLPGRRVICGIPDVCWEEQLVPHDHPVYELFTSFRLKAAISELLDCTGDWDLTCWISRYRTGEYISAHTDKSGVVQILLMLRSVPADNGGVLTLMTDRGNVAVNLYEGDALYFRATSINHFTTPLIPTTECPSPTRVVAVGRYFPRESKRQKENHDDLR